MKAASHTGCPRVSVVMSVYNGLPHLDAAIRSILGQSFSDLELIIVDDGSTDGTLEAVRRYSDPSIRVLRQPTNLGLTRSLNRGLAEARGQYIARIDADDVALPDRLAVQVDYLERHPEVLLLAGRYQDIYGDLPRDLGDLDHPRGEEEISFDGLMQRNTIPHSSVMFPRRLITDGLTYREAFYYSQDYDLWLRIALLGRVVRLGQYVCLVRRTPAMITLANTLEQRRSSERARLLALQRQSQGTDELDQRGQLPAIPPARDREIQWSVCDAFRQQAMLCFRLGYPGFGARLLLRSLAVAPLLSVRAAIPALRRRLGAWRARDG